MLLSLTATVQSVSSPAALAALCHPPTSRGPQNLEPFFVGKWTENNRLVALKLSKFNARFANNLATWFLPVLNEKGSMVYQPSGPQLLLLRLHQLRSYPPAFYYLISSHRLPHILLKILVSLERLRLLISLQYLPSLEIYSLDIWLTCLSQYDLWSFCPDKLFSYFWFNLYIYTSNGSSLTVAQSDNITLISDLSGRLTLPFVFCIPKLTLKLLSVGKPIDYNYNVLFTPTSCIVQDHTGERLGQDTRSTTYISWSLFIFPHHYIPQWVSLSHPIHGIINWDIYLSLG